MSELLLTLATGAAVGFVFGLVKLPIPAPTVFAGIVGIFGIWGGYQIALLVVEAAKRWM